MFLKTFTMVYFRLLHRVCEVAACFLVSVILFAGCASKTVEVESPVDTTDAFAKTGTIPMPENWWEAFEDPELDALIRQAFDGNLNLQASWERLQAAQAVSRREAAAFLPRLDGSAGGNARGSNSGGSQTVELGLAASYEVDLWGRIQADVDAERFRAEAGRADYEATALTLSAEVALVWYRLLEAESSLELLEDQIEANEKTLQSLMGRFRGGQVRSVDLLRQQQLLEATRERCIQAESDRAVLEHQLSVLMGRPAQKEVGWTTHQLPSLAPLPQTGAPADLVLRRPDIQSALHQVEASDRDVAAAIADRYPRLNITGSLSTASQTASQLFTTWMGTIAAEMVAPIIDGGRRKAEVQRTEAVKRQRVAEFGQATLNAFREVEDALVREERQRERITNLSRQVEIQAQAHRKLQTEYFNGVSDFIDVLTALTQTQRLRRDLLIAKRQLIEFRISLYRSLAGPVGPEQAPVEP